MTIKDSGGVIPPQYSKALVMHVIRDSGPIADVDVIHEMDNPNFIIRLKWLERLEERERQASGGSS